MSELQLAILKLVHAGRSTAEIAVALSIDRAQVDSSIRRACRQLGVTGRRDAAHLLASQHGWPAAPASRRPSRPISTQFGPDVRILLSETAPIRGETEIKYAYVGDVGSQQPATTGWLRTANEIADLLISAKADPSYHVLKRVLTIAVLILSAAFSVSVLVSAMQGLEQIMRS